MKQLTTLFFFFAFSSVQASTYLAQVGPFYADAYSEQAQPIKKCKTGFSKLSLSANASGKLAMPRFNYRDINIEFKNGKTIQLSSKKEIQSLKEISVKIPSDDCVSNVRINAMSTGFNPGHSDEMNIELWASR